MIEYNQSLLYKASKLQKPFFEWSIIILVKYSLLDFMRYFLQQEEM